MIITIVRYICDVCGIYKDVNSCFPLELPAGWKETSGRVGEAQHCGRCSAPATRGIPREAP